jgi:UDP-N-acetylglucosamine--N-acetylmuramyl-(pentapeptide) pyrophosphoryl-undecaprenol N-acetylglucosamine transferase
MAALPELLQAAQVLHISGQLDWAEVEQARLTLSPEQAARYRLYPYLHQEMAAALACADLALTRAGASCLGELPLFGLPAILAPYPYAWRYQRVNADYLASRGAAEVVEDAELSQKLLPLVHALLADQPRRQQMAQAMRQLARPAAAQHIAELLSGLADRRN